MAKTTLHAHFNSNILYLMQETFEGPPQPSSAYLDQGVGLFSTLESLSAEQASRPITPGGTSVAAQAEHTRFYLGVLERAMQGDSEKVDWRESWQMQTVTPEEWEALKGELRAAYGRIMEAFRANDLWDEDRIGGAMAILVHSAYHLGAIRQIMRAVQAG